MIIGFNENGIDEMNIHNHLMFDEPMETGGKFYFLFDGLGSVTGLTDTGGNLGATYSYDAFGNILSETGDATLNAINPYRYTSRVYDKESGLYYYRARYYDSKTGRFTQKDPIQDVWKSGKGLYVYVENNPVNVGDPEGTGWHCCGKTSIYRPTGYDWGKVKECLLWSFTSLPFWFVTLGLCAVSCLLTLVTLVGYVICLGICIGFSVSLTVISCLYYGMTWSTVTFCWCWYYTWW